MCDTSKQAKMDASRFDDIVMSLSYMSMDQLTALRDEVSILKCIQDEADYAEKQKTMLHEVQVSFVTEGSDLDRIEQAVANLGGTWVSCDYDNDRSAVSFEEKEPGNLVKNMTRFVKVVREAGGVDAEISDVLDIGQPDHYRSSTRNKFCVQNE